MGIALLPAAFAFQMFSSVNWAGVLAGMVALGVLAVMAIVLGNLIVPIAMGAAAIALLGVSLIPFGVAASFCRSRCNVNCICIYDDGICIAIIDI